MPAQNYQSKSSQKSNIIKKISTQRNAQNQSLKDTEITSESISDHTTEPPITKPPHSHTSSPPTTIDTVKQQQHQQIPNFKLHQSTMGTSLLSPMAKPFQPSYHDMDNNIMEFAIFNNGVPSSVYYGVHPEHEVLHNISDDALDERFPPSAADAAEMDAAEEFVEFMAWLSYLDECDEEARFTFCDIKKRWEARRAQGLVGKPHHPRTTSSTSMANDKRCIKANNVDETTLVSFVPSQKNNKKGGVKIDKRRLLGPKKLMAKGSAIHGYSCAHPTIHQPRKHN